MMLFIGFPRQEKEVIDYFRKIKLLSLQIHPVTNFPNMGRAYSD